MTVPKREKLSPGNSFRLVIAPQFHEFDAGGVLYHANYFHLYERAREDLLRQGGVPYISLMQSGRHLAINESYQQFLHPVVYGTSLEAAVWVSDLKGASCRFNYEFSEQPDLAATEPAEHTAVVHRAWTKHVLVAGFRPGPFSDDLRGLLKAYA